jgi:hypothetical protein
MERQAQKSGSIALRRKKGSLLLMAPSEKGVTFAYVPTSVRMYVCVYVCMYVCMYVCVYIYIYVCM